MKKTTYQAALTEVQKIVNELQEESVSIDDLSSKIERVTELIQFCRTKLRDTEENIKKTI